MEAQEIFDTVTDHLRRQGCRSVNKEGDCLYRGPDGLMCAVGCLLTDDEVENIDEGWEVDQIILPERLENHVELLYALQHAHDEVQEKDEVTGENIFQRELTSMLKGVATRFNLTLKPSGE